MSQPAPSALSLDNLIALSDEIAALARAGVPLERGLAELGREMPGRLGRFAAELAGAAAAANRWPRPWPRAAASCPPCTRRWWLRDCGQAACRPSWRPWHTPPGDWPKPAAA